ncbi:hypothetical protein BKG71_22885 [Mycobacteroides chelonae]|uniref:hypothetical protein n=1 Tax=Mycobacteroides chelonae TaxID=1774 RepID=UPI0008A9FC4B|nr:hypothetical protein [Mycobacteroides chelonae]OHT95543.1 hypothetical protein BKG71_22885 [Mycobacteroides chelonae]
MSAQMTLPTCCLPGCVQVVAEWGQACQTCISGCGHFLQRVSSGAAAAPGQLAGVFAERDRATGAAYAAQAESDIALGKLAGKYIDGDGQATTPWAAQVASSQVVRKAMQVCWMCEERRSCTHIAGRWECDQCRDIT